MIEKSHNGHSPEKTSQGADMSTTPGGLTSTNPHTCADTPACEALPPTPLWGCDEIPPTGNEFRLEDDEELAPAWTSPHEFNNPLKYLLVGCDLYYRGVFTDARGDRHEKLIPWRFSQLKRDFANNPIDMDRIPRYLGLGSYPSHIAYREEVNGLYNTYSRIDWQPVPGEWPNIRALYEHIFGDQIEFGYDYTQLLYTNPVQMLPIIVLVSQERETGKTTFLNLLKAIFGQNMAFVTNDTMRSKFNAERASRLIIACDEAFLNKKEDSERLKALSTAQKTFIEFKGKDRYEIDNFAKIIMCSNNVNDPVYIDSQENRYVVREVGTLPKKDPGLLVAMRSEIPAFLYFLLNRRLSVPEPLSRMWFDMDQLRTPALERIVRKCRPTPELELAEFLLDQMDFYGVDCLQYTRSDLNTLLKAANCDIRDVHWIICKSWDVPHANNKLAYDLYAPWITSPPYRDYGRYYTFTRAFLLGLVPDYAPSGNPGSPTAEGTKVTTGSLFTK